MSIEQFAFLVLLASSAAAGAAHFSYRGKMLSALFASAIAFASQFIAMHLLVLAVGRLSGATQVEALATWGGVAFLATVAGFWLWILRRTSVNPSD